MGNWNSGRRPGRPPTPTSLKVLRGNPGKRPLPVHEPRIERASPDFETVPEELQDDPVAIKEWERVVPLLRASGMIATVERLSLITLCQQWSHYLEAHRNVRRLGMLVKGANNVPHVNPFFKLSHHALNQCQRLWVELGMTPSARSRLTALAPDAPEKVSKWAGDL